MENLVVCVDRDDDVGRKTKAIGPIIGVEENISIAKELALIDPEDTDTNAIFAAVKVAKELGTEVVTLTGDRKVGVISDTKLAAQLDLVLERFKPAGIILVIDGAEDEQIIPVIESRVKINSVKTVIVRQSQELEKAYSKIVHFIKEVEEDANLARLVFGIPGLVLMLLAIGGVFGILAQAMNIVLAVIGVYLLIKGFGYEEEFFTKISRFLKSLSVEKISTFTYAIAVIVLVIALVSGFENINGEILDIDMLAEFIIASADFILAAVVIAVVGKIMDDYSASKYLNVRTDLIFLSFAFLLKLSFEALAKFMISGLPAADFLIAVIAGFVIFFVVVKVTEYFFIEEINARRDLIAEFANREVYNERDEAIGKVNRVLLDGSKLIGLKVNRRIIHKEDIVARGDRITVKSD